MPRKSFLVGELEPKSRKTDKKYIGNDSNILVKKSNGIGTQLFVDIESNINNIKIKLKIY